MNQYKITPKVKRFSQIFLNEGFSLYLVGGAVRDYFLKKELSDLDFATNAQPKQIIKICKRNKLHVIPTGISHGTLTIIFEKEHYEVTTFRCDGNYSDSRHPDAIEFVGDLYEDLKRRDFTINALAVNTKDGSVIDMHNGLADLDKKTVKAIGDPVKRFKEDALRMMRACRFSSQLEFGFDKNTFDAIKELSYTIINVSHERIRDELNKILLSRNPSIGLKLLYKTDLLKYISPDLYKTTYVEVRQSKFKNLYNLSLAIVDKSSCMNADLIVRLSCLFFDIAADNKNPYKREKDSSIIADKVLKDLKYSNDIRKTVVHLISLQRFNYTEDWSDGTVRRFVNNIGRENIRSMFQFRLAKDYILGKNNRSLFLRLLDRIDDLTTDAALSIKDLKVNGHDMMKIGLQGKEISTALNILLEAVLDDPSLNTKNQLLLLASDNLPTNFS